MPRSAVDAGRGVSTGTVRNEFLYLLCRTRVVARFDLRLDGFQQDRRESLGSRSRIFTIPAGDDDDQLIAVVVPLLVAGVVLHGGQCLLQKREELLVGLDRVDDPGFAILAGFDGAAGDFQAAYFRQVS